MATTENNLVLKHLEKLGDKDWYLTRTDAAIVCRAIAMSLPLFSCQGIKARIASVICQYKREADMWLCSGCFHKRSSLRWGSPVTDAANSYLKKQASDDVLNNLQLVWDHCVGEGGQPCLQLENLYDLLMRGWSADSFRAHWKFNDQISG